MKLIRYEYPKFCGIDRVFDAGFANQSRLNSVWDHFLRNDDTPMKLAMDVFENEQNYFVRFEVPGVQKEAVDLNFQDSLLTLKVDLASKNDTSEHKSVVSRSVRLPEYTSSERISAKLEDGILTVTVPKSTQAQKKRIEVK